MISHSLPSLAALAAMVGPGFLYVRRVAPGLPRLPALAVGHLIGAAALTWVTTLGLWLTGRVAIGFGVVGLGALLAAAVLSPSDKAASPPPPPHNGQFRSIDAALALLVLAGAALCLVRAALLPLGWDGFAIWQLKALAMAQGTLPELLTSPRYDYAHPDYPLLVPTHSWWLTLSGFDSKLAQFAGLLFAADLLVLFWWAARTRVGRFPATLGSGVILSWGLTSDQASSGCADLPLAVYFFALLSVLVSGHLRLALLLLPGALATKNEGLVVAAVVMGVAALGHLDDFQGGQRMRERLAIVLLLATVAVVAVIPWMAVKRHWGLHGDILNPDLLSPARLAGAAPRLRRIAGALARETLDLRHAPAAWGALWLVGLWSAALALRRRVGRAAPLWECSGAYLVIVVASFLLMPYDVDWTLTALPRVLLHVAPLVLLASLTTLEEPAHH